MSQSFLTEYKQDILVKEYVCNIFDEKHLDPLSTICLLCNGENKKNGFTFGNAQKIVNMVAKYMYITTYKDDGKRMLFEECHCPMDRYMINFINEKFPENKITVSWSRLEYKDDVVPAEYIEFQKRVKELADKEELLPVEYDYVNW